MEKTLPKLKATINASHGGAVIGAILGWTLAKFAGYEKALPVVSFTLVGVILGATIGHKINSKA